MRCVIKIKPSHISCQLQTYYAYDVFGALRAQTGTSDTYWGFAGEQTDEATGFQYLRARYYDPGTGRFLTRDPLMGFVLEPQTHNPYAYALNNPVNRVDTTGLASESVSPFLTVLLGLPDLEDFILQSDACLTMLGFMHLGAGLIVLGGATGNPYLILTGGLSLFAALYVWETGCKPGI